MDAEPAQLPLGRMSPGFKPKAKVILIGLVALALVASMYVWARKEVMVTIAGGQTMVLQTLQRDVAGLLAEAEVEVSELDLVEPDLDTPLEAGMEVIVRRARPVVAVIAGERVEFASAQPTVALALDQAGISVGPLDLVEPGLHSPLPTQEEIIITRVREEEITEEVTLPYQVRRRQDDNLLQGQTKTVTEGKEGLARQVVRIVYEDDEKVAEQVVSQKVLQEPVAQVVAVGTAQPTISRGGSTLRYREVRTMEATAYSADPRSTGIYADGLTATGAPARRGVVAVDPRVIPLGTRLYVDGYGHALAADVGGAIKGNKIDLCFDTHEEAVRFGRRQVTVYILQ